MAKRPNFLVIVADDLGFSDVGCYGGEISTPNIDGLAKHGMRFTDFHAAAACSPTRSMLLSGTDNHIAGVGTMIEKIQDFQIGKPGYEGYLNDRVVALPELLQDAGYHTMMSGKWHLGLTPDRFPCQRGFSKSYSLLPGAANHYGWEPQLLDKDEKRPRIMDSNRVFYVEDDKPIEPENLGEDFYSTDAFADKMLEYLQDRHASDETREKPFFAYLAFSAPHWPLQAPEEDIESYRGVYHEGPEALRQQRVKSLKKLGLVPEHAVSHEVISVHDRTMSKAWETMTADEQEFSSRTMEIYAGMVQRMDTQIGRVLEYLGSTDDLDDTLVLFMSDNGAEGLLLEAVPVIEENVFDYIAQYHDNSLENMGKKNSYVWYGPHWASAATAPSRLYKSFTSEGGIRVPLILTYPPLTRTSEKIEHAFATVMDIAPTILELAGVEHPAPTYRSREIEYMRGVSWVPFLTGSRETIHDDEHVTGWELFGRQAVRKGEWKALFIPKPYGPERWQLYNLSEDPGETRDLGAKRPDKLGELMVAWERYVQEVGLVGAAVQYGVLAVE